MACLAMFGAAAPGGAESSAEPRPVAYDLSPAAREVAALLDRGAYQAAERLFDARIDVSTTDAGLYVLYARFLIETQPPASPGFTVNPIQREDTYDSLWLAGHSCELALEFEPEIGHYLADVMLRSLHRRDPRLDGFIAADVDFPMVLSGASDPFEHSMLKLGWLALDASRASARRWSEAYWALALAYARKGKVASAMMVANLSGDLEDGDRSVGEEDFRRATGAFAQALEHQTADDVHRFVEKTLIKYKTMFGVRLSQLSPAVAQPPEIDALAAQLARRGLTLSPQVGGGAR